ncbi:hypothetical protein V8F20_012463 [Naviculisporaceae sp. PSN 640]
MTLTTATQLTSRAHCARRASLGAVAAAAVVRHPQQQARGYRFGRLRSSYFDLEFSRNDCRRQRHFRYKYAETLSRRLSGDQNSVAPGVGDAKPVLRNCWDPNSRLAKATTGRVPQQSPDNPEGIRPGQNIEDAERAPLEDLLFGHHHEGRGPEKAAKSKKHRRAQSGLKNTSEADADYFIDPITNRKVHRSRGPDITVNSFKSYRSQFGQFTAPSVQTTQAPIFYDGPPPEAELKKYSQVKLDDPDISLDLLDAIARKHRDVSWHDSRGVVSPRNWRLGPDTSEYTDLHKYSPRLDEHQMPPDQQPGIQYGDLDKYGAVKYQEPDGVFSRQEPVDKSEDLESYTAVRSHEPDGKYKTQEDAGVVGQTNLDKYEAVGAREADVKYDQAEDSVQQYEDLEKYGPVQAHEPDGKYKAQDHATTNQYEDLYKYEAVRVHEPDGKYKAEVDATVTSEVDPEELSRYGAFRSHEPDGLYAASYSQSTPDAEELAQYKPFRSCEPDGKYAAILENGFEDRVEEARYQAFRSHEPDGKYSPGSQIDSSTEYPDLASYGAFRSHEPDGKYATEQLESAEKSPELGQYRAVRSHEPDGKYAAQSESCTEVSDLGNHEAFGYEDTETKTLPPRHEFGADLKGYKTVHHNEVHKPTASYLREENHSPRIPLEQPETTPETSSKGLTGNYARDFPEDPLDPYSKEPQGLETSYVQECGKQVPIFATIYSPSNSGPDSSESAPPAAAAASSESTTPTLYKVLVYDPTRDSVEIAETTSIVPDSTTSLTLPEILLRISNPAKFVPHFPTLQAQGYEIASGNGDILIFRKVREAARNLDHSSTVSSTTAHGEPGGLPPSPTPINPIDMTGGGLREFDVAASRFASPTGFVNYDLPPFHQEPRSYYPAESAAEASQQQPISGQHKSEASEESPRRKEGKSVLRRVLVGAVWAGSLSYSLAVVGDYFKTGGADGKGTRGRL